MKKNKNKIKDLALKFFIPACAIMLWYPTTSLADTANNSNVEQTYNASTSNSKSGLRETEIMMLKMIHERKMLEEYNKTQRAVAKDLAKKQDINGDVFMTDINFYNQITKIRKA